jgi:hypothetical protein
MEMVVKPSENGSTVKIYPYCASGMKYKIHECEKDPRMDERA